MKKGKMKTKNGIMLITLGIIAAAIVVIAVIGNLSTPKETVPAVETVAVKKRRCDSGSRCFRNCGE